MSRLGLRSAVVAVCAQFLEYLDGQLFENGCGQAKVCVSSLSRTCSNHLQSDEIAPCQMSFV